MSSESASPWWNLELETMPHFEQAMQRIYAWYRGEVIDRPPVRFMAPLYTPTITDKPYPGTLKDKWFDAEFRVEAYIESITGRIFHGETFPFFYPFLGVDVYAAFYGVDLIFDEKTSWAQPVIHTWDDVAHLRFDRESNPYFQKIEELTRCALERCRGKFMVAYTSMHPGVDCAAAWRGYSALCLDLIDNPERVVQLIDLALADFAAIFNYFDATLKEHHQLSLSWLAVPSFTTMHIPGCDFAAMISPRDFERFCLPALQREVQVANQNIFHLDGRGVARHLDMILEVPEIDAIQWAQGAGDSRPIMQWIPLIKKIQAHKPVIVDIPLVELEDFISVMRPEGLYLWVQTESEEQELAVLRRLEHWT
ncbi:MAG: hypothetical protein Kow00124_12070 [Anaerolineae bacterium]